MQLTTLQQLYFQEAPDLKPSSLKRAKCELNRWLKNGGPSDAASVSKSAFAAFRAGSTHLSAVSLESTINEVMRLIRFAHSEGLIQSVPSLGRRLRRRRKVKYIPPVDHLGLLYRVLDAELRRFVALGYTTGLRFSDLLSLRHENLERERSLIRVVAQKTGKPQTLPLLPCVLETIDPETVVGPLFSLPSWDVRRGLARGCKKLGIPIVTPQGIRRTAANAYEHARPGAGTVLLGHSISGASGFYLDVPQILTQAAGAIPIPF